MKIIAADDETSALNILNRAIMEAFPDTELMSFRRASDVIHDRSVKRYLTEEVYKKPIFVTDYPKEIKAFYMRMNDDGKTVAACDLLVPGVGEIIGGSQREERLDMLKKRMKELDLDEKDYWWYLELRKYGGVEHSGYGLGFERIIMYITGMSNIRDVIPFPRTPNTAEF